MKCPWQTIEDTYKYRDVGKIDGYGIRKEIVFGECAKNYCPFYNSEEQRCDRVDVSTGRLRYEDNLIDPKEGTAEEEPHWIKQIYSDGGYNYLCTSCMETSVGDNSKYCPNCGKKMSDVVYRKHVDSNTPDEIDIDDGC